MPRGVYVRTKATRIAVGRGSKRAWARKTPEQKARDIEASRVGANKLEAIKKKCKSEKFTHNLPEVKLEASEKSKRAWARKTPEQRAQERENRRGKKDSEKTRKSKSDSWKRPERRRRGVEAAIECQNRVSVSTLKSVRRALAYAEGRLQIHGDYITGYYRKTHFFRSFLEYRAMKVFDILKWKWTEKHGITIPWRDERGIVRNYSPDFCVDGRQVIETKGYLDKSVLLKAEASMIYTAERDMTYELYFEEDIVRFEKQASEDLGWTFRQYQMQLFKERSCYKQKKDKRKAFLKRKKEEENREKACATT